jgi:hypothetical protein
MQQPPSSTQLKVQTQLTVEDDKWHDRTKFQVQKNPELNIDYY